MNIFQSIGTTEWIIIAVIILFLFGGKKIPEFFKGVADAIKEFKKAANDESDKPKEK
jgi:sec-independent protein translocase protein TatA